jgi:hypothetical protein
MNKNTSNDFEKETPDFLAIKNSSQSKNSFQINDLTQDQISKKSQFHEDLLVDHEIVDHEIINNPEISRDSAITQELEITPYQKALFKKRIFWQATIFALKIVIPVVIMAIILMQFTK